ncbi:probable E3 ubiquitin-protein ligase ATL45 [Setaria viridis]|uniref:probable E3 ubiquitin-protein ligase ATL45 n=1 Tax=Setaria viridis TaxID=4556 RepID=UPI0014937B9C|nr:probable E3 ubiquitin-protein ligase ATL45 [Setaria viridis]
MARLPSGGYPPPGGRQRPDLQACSSRRAAASSDAILGLQEVGAGDATQTECAVCLQDLNAEETLRAMPCSHAFHQHCIFDWLRRNGACPLCRHQLLPAEQEDIGSQQLSRPVPED